LSLKNFKISEEASKNETERKSTLKIYYRKRRKSFDFSILRDIGYGSGEEALGFKIIAKLDSSHG
jgi:hypothetical protein